MSILDKFKSKKQAKPQESVKDKSFSVSKADKNTAGEYSTIKAKDEKQKAVKKASKDFEVKEKAAETAEKPKKSKDTKDAYRILVRPLVTEKATEQGTQNKYVFEVNISSNKVQVKKAIKSVYGVDPVDVNIVRMRGKNVTYGRVSGKRKARKKAVITLKPGDKIEIYEGV